MTRSKVSQIWSTPVGPLSASSRIYPQRTHDKIGHVQFQMRGTTASGIVVLYGRLGSGTNDVPLVAHNLAGPDFVGNPTAGVIELNHRLHPELFLLVVGGPATPTATLDVYLME